MATESGAAVDLTKINGVLPFWGTKRRLPAFPYAPYPDSPFSKLQHSLLLEILIRLPNPKSAVRCKSVCRWWAILISSRAFIARFVSHHETTVGDDGEQPPLILPGNPQPILDFLPAPDEIRRKLRVLDSSHDLILCGTEEKERSTEMRRTLVVCNPFTKQWVALPLAPERKRYDRSIVRLVFGPGNLARNLNQGFMVVCMYLDGFNLSADIFCSASGKWSRDGIAFNWSTGRFPARNVASCNGRLYWRNMSKQIVVYNPLRESSLLFLDISKFFVERLTYCDVWASQGVLHLILMESQCIGSRSNDILCVWRWDEGGVEQWKKLYRVYLKDMVSEVKGMEMKRVLGMHPNKPEILFLEFVHPDGNSRVLSCNLQREELQFFTQYLSSLSPLDPFHWNVFQPILRWPTQIPDYEKLRGGYDGSSSFWIQKSSNKSTAACSFMDGELQRLGL